LLCPILYIIIIRLFEYFTESYYQQKDFGEYEMILEAIRNYLFVSVPEKYKREFRLETYKINMARCKVAAIVLILIKIMLLAVSLVTNKEQFYNALTIYHEIMYVIMIIIMAIYLTIFLKIEKSIPKNDRINLIVVVSFTSFILMWCAVISLLDQLSYGHVIVYAAAFMVIAVFSFFEPIVLLLIYISVHVLFIVCIPYFQKHSEIIFKNYIISTTYLILSWVVSIILYKYWVNAFNNKKKLQEKNDDLNILNIKLEEANHRLEKISCIDSLTGAYNRRKFNQVLKSEWERCKRYSIPISILMIDIDHFKSFNDNYGHQAGDSCIRQVAKVLLNYASRSSDIVARYGGEEFAIVLPHTNSKNTLLLAERIRKGIEELSIPHAFSLAAQHVTISLGTCTIIPSDDYSIDKFISSADKALYKAKLENRNLVIAAAIDQ
jgi:diguanylate cyclase (GGDEF)-like protein